MKRMTLIYAGAIARGLTNLNLNTISVKQKQDPIKKWLSFSTPRDGTGIAEEPVVRAMLGCPWRAERRWAVQPGRYTSRSVAVYSFPLRSRSLPVLYL